MDRKTHLEWCKQRAIEYLEEGDVRNAWASMCSDLQKHEETKDHADIQLGMMLVMTGNLSSVQQMKEFILGFN